MVLSWSLMPTLIPSRKSPTLLDRAWMDGGIAARVPQEKVLFVIPKRNIETWLACLRGYEVEETTAYLKYDCESDDIDSNNLRDG